MFRHSALSILLLHFLAWNALGQTDWVRTARVASAENELNTRPVVWSTTLPNRAVDDRFTTRVPGWVGRAQDDEEDEPEAKAPVAAPKIWSGRIEIGVNGSEGNSVNFKTRAGVHATRKTDDGNTTLDFTYGRATQNDALSENKVLFSGRHEWLYGDSPWSIYAYQTDEYDQFKAWDVRITGGGGLSYQWFKDETSLFKTRFGAGVAHEFGGPDDRLIPELNMGFDFEWKLTDRQKFTATLDAFPEIGDFGSIRVNTKVAWELLVDPANNLSLQLGILDRYDSTPNGAKANDIDYFALLIWGF